VNCAYSPSARHNRANSVLGFNQPGHKVDSSTLICTTGFSGEATIMAAIALCQHLVFCKLLIILLYLRCKHPLEASLGFHWSSNIFVTEGVVTF